MSLQAEKGLCRPQRNPFLCVVSTQARHQKRNLDKEPLKAHKSYILTLFPRQQPGHLLVGIELAGMWERLMGKKGSNYLIFEDMGGRQAEMSMCA